MSDPALAHNQSEDVTALLYNRIQLALREAVETQKLEQLLAGRAAISQQLTHLCTGAAAELGLRLHGVAVKDLMLPADLKKAYADVVKAQKEGQAVLERARGETAALRSLANAARLVEDQPMLLQLRCLQSVGQGTGNTVVVGSAGPVVQPGAKPKGQATTPPSDQ